MLVVLVKIVVICEKLLCDSECVVVRLGMLVSVVFSG